MDAIEVHINDKATTLKSDANVTHLFDHLKMTHHQGIAIAINNEVIPKGHWHQQILKQGDKILIITASQGG